MDARVHRAGRIPEGADGGNLNVAPARTACRGKLTGMEWDGSGGSHGQQSSHRRDGRAVWKYLKDHGKSALRALEQGVDASPLGVSMAAGWLAREGKVEVAQEKRSLYLRLTKH